MSGIRVPKRGEKREAAKEHKGGKSIKEHLMEMHREHGGDHMHVHMKGGKIVSHHVIDGECEGPHEHAGMGELASHMEKVMPEMDGEE
jgi:hypothetical protein